MFIRYLLKNEKKYLSYLSHPSKTLGRNKTLCKDIFYSVKCIVYKNTGFTEGSVKCNVCLLTILNQSFLQMTMFFFGFFFSNFTNINNNKIREKKID